MKKFIMLLLVLLLVFSLPSTAFAGMVKLYSIQVSAVDNHGELRNPRSINGQTYRANTEIDLMTADPVPYKGYYFKGWQILGDPSILTDTKIIVTQHCEYRSVFSSIGYQVAFDLQNGSSPSIEMKSFGEEISEPVPMRDYFEFGGWYLDAQCSGERVAFPYTVNADVTFYAKWLGAYCDVRFFDEEGQQIGETQRIEYDKCAKAPDDLTKEGHTFNGWNNGTQTLSGDDIDEQKVTDSVDYTAEFSANLYDIRFFDEDGEQIGETQQIEYDQCAKAPNDLAKEGHMFNGWKNGTETLSGKAIGEQKVTGAVDYTAEFSANVYDVRFFDEDGQQIGDIQQIEYNQCAKAPDDLTKEGHTFKGWYDGTQILSKSEVNDGQVIKAMDYTAVFKINNYVVTFMANGTAEKKHVAFNSLIPELETPTRQGHDFAGWLTDEGEQWNFATDSMPASNIALNASWDIRKYTVTFYEQNGEIPIGAPQTVNWGGAVVIETAPAITGYAFDQWVLSGSDASETDSLACVKENINAVACYTKNKYSVTFIDDQGQVIGTDSVCDGGSATAPNVPEKQGYTFIGWDNSFDNVTGNTMVAAQYTANTYTVRFLDNDGSELSTQTVNWNTAATAPADPQREGYTFTGWDTAFDNVTSDITVTAQYERILALANSVGNDELENDVSTSTSYDIESGNNEHLKGNDNGEWIILRDEAIPAASSETNDQSRYRESVSHRNRVSFLNHFSEYIIILLCLLSALALGLSIWIVRARKKY